MSPRSDTLAWFWAIQTLPFLFNAVFLVEKQQMMCAWWRSNTCCVLGGEATNTNFVVFGLIRSIALEASTLTITPTYIEV